MSNIINGLDKWNHILDSLFSPMQCTSLLDVQPNDFSGLLSTRQLNRTALSLVTSKPISVIRTTAHISVAVDAYYLIKFQIKGHCIVQQYGREVHLGPGDFVICSTIDPYQLNFPNDYSQLVFSIPQSVLHDVFESPEQFLARRMGKEFASHGILSQFVHHLSLHMSSLDPKILQSMEANIIDLLITTLKATTNTREKISDNAPEQHLHRLKRFIALNIKDPRLGVDFIAKSEHISKRYLHKLFKDFGMSVSRYILQLRLDGCYQDLTNHDLQHLSTTDMAFEWGFGDISHFHRCFKARYQITPRQWRLQAH